MNSKFIFMLGLASTSFLFANPSQADQAMIGALVDCPTAVCSTFQPGYADCKSSDFSCRLSSLDQNQITAYSGRQILVMNKDGSNIKKINLVENDEHYSPEPNTNHSSVILRPDGGYTFIQAGLHWVVDPSNSKQPIVDSTKSQVIQIDTTDSNLKVLSSVIPQDSSGQVYSITTDQVSVASNGHVFIQGNNGQTLEFNPQVDQNALEQSLLKLDTAAIFGANFEKSYYALTAKATVDETACTSEANAKKAQSCQDKVQKNLQDALVESAKSIVKAHASLEDSNAQYFYEKGITKAVPTVADLYNRNSYLQFTFPAGKVYSYALTLDGSLIIQAMACGFQTGGGISAVQLGGALIGQTLETAQGNATPNVAFAPVSMSPY